MTQHAAPKTLHIFKSGQHMAANGRRIAFTEADLQATVKAYDPTKHEAPLVVGHPKHDLPAYGWVKQLAFTEAGLDAAPTEVNPEFAEMVSAKSFKKISASFYAPDAPNNPVPGVYYLRHVGFLGAEPPAIKGLRDASFSEAEPGVLTFSEWDDVDVAWLFRNLREWFIGKFGLDEADKVLPGYTVRSIEQGAQDELAQAKAEAAAEAGAVGGAIAALPTPSFSEPQRQESDVTEAEKLRADLAALQAENATLRTSAKAARTNSIHAEHVAFSETLKGITPAFRSVVVATLDHLAEQDTVVEFGEGDARAPLQERLRAMFAALPAVVEFGEHATMDQAAGSTVDFSDASSIAAAAVAYQTQQQAKGIELSHAQAVAALAANRT